MQKEGYNAGEKGKMLLSKETMEGLRMTGILQNKCTILKTIHVCLMNIIVLFLVTSFLEVGPILLEDQSVQFLLTERFSQDAVESYFGDQRSRGHRNTNPNIQQFSITANILRVSTGLSRKERGNVRGRKRDATTTSTLTLRKRVQKRKT